MNKQRIAEIIKTHRYVVNNKDWPVLLSVGNLTFEDKIDLSIFLVEQGINPFEDYIKSSKMLGNRKALLEVLDRFYGLADHFNNFDKNTAAFADGLTGNEYEAKEVRDIANIAQLLGYTIYETDIGYWGNNPGYIIAYPTGDLYDGLREWYESSDPALDENDKELSFSEWIKDYNVKEIGHWL